MSLIKLGDAFRRDTQEWIEHWEADTKVELGNIPKCNYGSTCTIRSTGEKYSVDEAGVWSFVGGGSGTSGLPSGSSPNQYLVTDGDGNAKWEDKLAWSEEGKVALVEPFTEEYGTETPNRNRFPLTLEEGKNYTVKWDGVEYDCTCFVDEWDRLVVGNASLMEAGANTNEPFLVGVQDGDSFVKAQTGGDHELSISCIGETIHPIDKKYLPSGSGGGSLIVHAIENSDDTVSSDKTRSEICDAIDSGKVVFLDMYGNFYPLKVVAFADGVVDRDSLIRFGGMSRIVDALYLVEIDVHEERTLIYNECKIQEVDM